MDKCHGDQCQDNAKVLDPVLEPLVQVKVGDQRPKNSNHSLPHDGDVHETAAHQALYQKKDDAYVAKYSAHKVTVMVRLCEKLQVCIPVNFSTAHRKHMDKAHGYLIILKFFLVLGPTKVINIVKVNEGCVYYWCYWTRRLLLERAVT